MSHTEYLPYVKAGRYEIQIEINVPCTDYPQISTEDIIIYDTVLNKIVPCSISGVKEGKELIEYLKQLLEAIQ